MTYKPNEILDGMTREEALACVMCSHDDKTTHWFVHGGMVYTWADDICLDDDFGDDFGRAINAYFDAKEAASKPRWVEPDQADTYVRFNDHEVLYGHSDDGWHAEIARTSARRKIEAFIKANGGRGNWSARHRYAANKEFAAVKFIALDVGTISCATEELAEAVIERYPDELRLLCGA